MTRPRVTLMDVAARAGVSRTTASFVMTGRRDMRISDEAERRVLQAARELDYRPNLLARSLRTNLSQTIGLISDVVASEPFAGEMIRGSLLTALNHEHLLFVGETEGDPQVEEQLVRSMLDRGVGGFLYASLYTREVAPSSLLFNQRLVLLNCIAPDAAVPSVVPDERAGGRAAAQTLLDAGHGEAIWLVGETPSHVLAGIDRIAGIREALAEAGFGLAGSTDTLWWPEPSYLAVRELLASGTRPTAFLCLNDRIALGVYQACGDEGLRIPTDVSVISFDDSDLASWCRPQMTSVALPHLELGRKATQLLLSRDQPPPESSRLPMPVRMRESVGPPPRIAAARAG